jgi:phospholipid/cholesterol/gamma-HCH transport system permease protein
MLQRIIAQLQTTIMPTSIPQVRQSTGRDGLRHIELSGNWLLRSLLPYASELQRDLAKYANDDKAEWDLRGIQQLDNAGALFLWRMWGRRRPNRIFEGHFEKVFADLSGRQPREVPTEHKDLLAPLRVIGTGAFTIYAHLQAIILLIGNLFLDALHLLRFPSQTPKREISANIHRTGTQALAITALVAFLVGVVLSYLSAIQLKAYGADIFIINILGVGILRELGPMLAAIIVAGRSGSSMTAQLGVMRITGELDALSVMAISHTLRLVLPKVLALAITMPLLILWSDAIALVGGMISASVQLNVDYHQFLNRLPAAVPIANLWLGVGKGLVFGAGIALISCHFGLQIKPNTESLGASTTNSVVTSITAVIIIDALFAVAFADVGFQV